MNLERLDIFLAVVDSGTLSAASRLVHLSQPAVSRNIKLLEGELGVELFARQGRSLVLTATGRSLVPRARQLVEQADRLARDLRRTAERRYFDLRLGSIDSVVSFLLPEVIEPIKAAFPELSIKLRTSRTANLLGAIDRDELDLAIIAYTGEPPAPRFHPVRHYDLQFYGRADVFPELAEVSQEAELTRFPIVELESLQGQPMLIPEDAASFAVTFSLASVKALILAGFGVGGLLDFMVSPAERRLLVRANIPNDPHCGLFVVGAAGWNGASHGAIEEALVESLRGALRH